MSAILILILASLGMALVFLACFIWATHSGQFDDTCTPALRVIADEPDPRTSSPDDESNKPL